jgi:hypothetical protein
MIIQLIVFQGHKQCSVEELKPYYQKVIAKYFPEKLKW